MGKVYSAHLISQLGYDFLFQDVDVMWFRNPLDFFSSPSYSGYDIILQDDGARNVRFQPYYANSGFYFARHNARTEYFFNSLIMAGPIILQSGCDQNTFAPVLQVRLEGTIVLTHSCRFVFLYSCFPLVVGALLVARTARQDFESQHG